MEEGEVDMSKNIFYHYTAKHLLPGIKKEGLTKGRTPRKTEELDKFFFVSGIQWITKDGNPYNQRWGDSKQRLGYDRNEVLIKINIPKNKIEKVFPMEYICDELGEFMMPGFNDFPEETKDWYCYAGNIPKEWIERIIILK